MDNAVTGGLKRTRRRRKQEVAHLVLWLLAGTAAAVLSLATVGVASSLILAGGWSIAALVRATLPALGDLRCWAAGVVIEITLLLGESFVLALIWPHAHLQAVNLFVLVLPLILALVGWFVLPRPSRVERDSTRSILGAQPWLALLIIVAIEAMFEAINLHGHYFGVAWLMNGDARNHVESDRTIMNVGGMTLAGLKAYPQMANVIAALVDAAGGRSGLTRGALMIRDVRAMVDATILFTVGGAMMFAAALSETLRDTFTHRRRLSLIVIGLLISCAALSVNAYVLGLVARGGFFPIIAVVCFALAALTLGMSVVDRYDNAALVLLTLTLFLVLGTWTLMVVVPASCLVVAYVALWWRRRAAKGEAEARTPIVTGLVVGFSFVCLLGVSLVLIASRSSLIYVIDMRGSIKPINETYVEWLGVLALLAVGLAPTARQRLVRSVPVVALAGCAAAMWWIHTVSPKQSAWPYYQEKMLWLTTIILLWVPFVLIIDVVGYLGRSRRIGLLNTISALVIAVSGSWTLTAITNHEAGWPFLFDWAYVGSTYPEPPAIDLMVAQADLGGPFVVYDYFDNGINDQLSNYWSALTWDFKPDGFPIGGWFKGSFVYWAATETFTVANLCQVLTQTPLRVITRSPTLKGRLFATCPAYRSMIRHS